MGFKCGIVGLPNVGKSTLFNALTQTATAEAANYPFCTIDPNTGMVPVPDTRLEACAEIAKSAQVIPTQLTFVDIAGLVRGASKGEGLGNQFLSHIREVDAIIQVLRCFEDTDITHVDGKVDPLADLETIETELMLADLESLEKRSAALVKRTRGNDDEAKQTLALVERAIEKLQDGEPARNVEVSDDEKLAFQRLQLLTTKPLLYICNVDEDSAAEGNELSAKVQAKAAEDGVPCIIISAAIESEIAMLESHEEQQEFLGEIGLEETGLSRIIRAGYHLLGLITYFTAGPNEARAWTIREGTKAPQAAGVIHTDFEKGFIRAETIAYDDYTTYGGEAGAKEAGRTRLEGKDYVVNDGDIMLFRFNT